MDEENSEISGRMTVSKSTFNNLLKGIIGAAMISAFLGGYVLGSETAEPEKIIIRDVDEVTGSLTTKQSTSNQAQSNTLIQVSLDDDPVRGNPNAPITIIEFSDFQCPFCARFHSQTLPLIEENYIKTGKVKFVYRDFPIQATHPNAVPAALASECADEQGKFWEYHDILFETQKEWEKLDVQSGINTFKQYAVELRLDVDSFNTCLETAKYLDEVRNDYQDAQIYGVSGTPGFFIGNEKIGFVAVSGAQPYAAFERLIEDQVARLDV